MLPDSDRAPAQSPLPARLPSLDGLRGLAILLVIAHMLGLLDAPGGFVGRAISYLFSVGWIGVQLFFVLSGFLITGIILDTQRAENFYSGFFARRTLRIFPLYYATLLCAFVLIPLVSHTLPASLEHDRQHQLWLWTYLANWSAPYQAGSRAFPHFWSLAVEEQFYLLWPFLLRRLNPTRCLWLCLGLALASLGARVALLAAQVPYGAIYTFSITRMDALVLGAAAAAAFRIPGLAARFLADRRRLWFGAIAILVAGALVTRGYPTHAWLGATLGYSFLSLAFAGMVTAAAADDAVRAVSPLTARPLRSIGKYSYAMYLFHKPLHDFVGKPLIARWGLDLEHNALASCAYVAGGGAVTFALAFASFHLFERRFLRLKDRFAPRRRS